MSAMLRSVGLRRGGQFAPPAPPFAPTDLPNLALWLDASDLATITQSSGRVSRWDDKSGNARDVTQTNTARQPTIGTRTVNGLNTILFATLEQHLLTAAPRAVLPQPNTVFAVAQPDTAIDGPIFDSPTGTVRHLIHKNSGKWAWYGGANQVSAASVVANAPVLLRALYYGASSQLAVNAGIPTTANAGSTDFTLIQIGKYQTSSTVFGGVICELLVYNRTLTATETNRVETYLADKWGINL